jgi:uncharacterized protein YjgD (DUF1641 family)
MAVAVDFRSFTPVDARVDLIKRGEGAPVEHAEAVLSAYDLLQQLHEKGILELLTGLLTAGETVVNHVVGIISSPQAVTATRLALMMVNMLGSIDADKISTALAVGLGLLNAFGDALEKSKPEKHG